MQNAERLAYFLIGKIFCSIIVPEPVVYSRALVRLNWELEFHITELKGL